EAVRLLRLITDTTSAYLHAQADAGAQALMLFDSWVGLLDAPDFDRFAAPLLEQIFAGLEHLDLPLLYFPRGSAHLLERVSSFQVDVVGIDWRTALTRARAVLGTDVTLQGNLDPAALFAPRDRLEQRIDHVLRQAGEGRHVFNLGHGIEPATDPDSVAFLVDTVHAKTAG
ncbi:MAG: uroporphyrinogen decarboxylase family protein, partial [Gemmatimonadota bacterium]